MIKVLMFLLDLSLVFAMPSTRPVVKTNYGKIRGHTLKSYGGRDFYAFNGIPYAKPPTGNLRFKAPVTPSMYAGVLDGSKDADDCYQIDMNYNQYSIEVHHSLSKNYVGDEDCLYLNVYTPSLEGDKLPVMVFIHGGAFKVGSGALPLQGPQFILDNDIILVTINYRLEILGFLRYDDVHLPGNLGLKDQSAALKWIKENIASFNGDPDSITIFGESAGGASVNFQLLAPQNKGIFHRAISQSGFVYCPWPIQTLEKAHILAKKLAYYLECPLVPEIMLHCLQEKSVGEIYEAYSLFDSSLPYNMDFKPVIENEMTGAFITEQSFKEGSVIPWIIGITSGEGIMFLEERLLVGDYDLSILNETYEQLLPKMFYMEPSVQSTMVARKIKQFYLGNNDFNMNNALAVTNLFSDALFNHGFYRASQNHRGKLYRYYFTHVGQHSFANNEYLPDIDLGVNHGDELNLQFYMSRYHDGPITLSDIDAEVSKKFINLWINFAKYGDPTPDDTETKWPESSETSEYLEISTDGLKVGSDLLKNRLNFWEDLYNSDKQIKDEL